VSSYRTYCEITEADSKALHQVAKFETQEELVEARVFKLSLGNSESYTVTDFTLIKEVTVISPNRSPVDIEITKAGPSSFTFQIDDAALFRGGALTGLKITNPSGSSTIKVQVIVGGT
jgi:hypothetical protein